MDVISLNKSKSLAQDKNYIVVDLRSSLEYYKGHVEGAISLPNASVKDIMKYGYQGKVWVFYCNRGSSSFKLARELEKVGYRVMAVAGGYK